MSTLIESSTSLRTHQLDPALWVTPAAQAPRVRGARTISSFRIEPTPSDRILRVTRHVALGQYRCASDHPHFAHPAPYASPRVAFHRCSLSLRSGPDRGIVTPLHVSLHNPWQLQTHETIGKSGAHYDWIALAPEFLRMLRARHFGVCEERDEYLFAHSICEITPQTFLARCRLFTAATRPLEALGSRQIDDAVEHLLVQILREAGACSRLAHAQRRHARGRRVQFVEEAKAVLARDYQAELSATDIAQRLHCSTAYLSRTFHAATGYKLVDYRHELRLRRGAYLIEEDDADIGEVAVRVGFASHSHFSSAFRRRFGITPSQYLRLH